MNKRSILQASRAAGAALPIVCAPSYTDDATQRADPRASQLLQDCRSALLLCRRCDRCSLLHPPLTSLTHDDPSRSLFPLIPTLLLRSAPRGPLRLGCIIPR